MNSIVRSSSILPCSVKALLLSLQQQLKKGIAVDGLTTNSSKVHDYLLLGKDMRQTCGMTPASSITKKNMQALGWRDSSGEGACLSHGQPGFDPGTPHDPLSPPVAFKNHCSRHKTKEKHQKQTNMHYS